MTYTYLYACYSCSVCYMNYLYIPQINLQVEWVLLDAHTHLLEMLTQNQKGNEELIANRCQRLSALIFNSTITGNAKLLKLQEEVTFYFKYFAN